MTTEKWIVEMQFDEIGDWMPVSLGEEYSSRNEAEAQASARRRWCGGGILYRTTQIEIPQCKACGRYHKGPALRPYCIGV